MKVTVTLNKYGRDFNVKHSKTITTSTSSQTHFFSLMSFRTICLERYQLDPAYYYPAPGLTWDAAHKYTDVKLDTLADINQHLFIERGIRGGISMITHRHAKANNPLLTDYDPAKPNSYILYLDANNLYGWAMSQPLSVGEFKWMTEEKLMMLLLDTF